MPTTIFLSIMVRTFSRRYSDGQLVTLEREIYVDFVDDLVSITTFNVWPFFVWLMQSDMKWEDIHAWAHSRRWTSSTQDPVVDKQFLRLWKIIVWFDNVFVVYEDGVPVRQLNPCIVR